MFTMFVSFEGERKIKADDILTALKIAMNYEADLYCDGNLVYSSMGLSYEDNKETLKQYGIIPKEHPQYIRWQYEDESKNITKLYCDFLEYKNTYTGNGEESLQINIHDYKHYKDSKEFNTYKELLEYVNAEYKDLTQIEKRINIVDFSNDECRSYYLNDLIA